MGKVLVLGGTRFFGKVLVEELLKAGEEVTIATRGITKDDFKDKVSRIVLDREERESIEKALEEKSFDVVYDNICYSPDSAKELLGILVGKTQKYIVTSSSAVYDFALNIKEEEFNPINKEITYGKKGELSYGEGKKQVESVVFNENNIPSIAVRFPVVLGEEDYTKRLYSYVDKIVNEIAIKVDNLDNKISFISAKEAGRNLAKLKDIDYKGPLNASSKGYITIRNIINYIEEKTQKKAILNDGGSDMPYNSIKDLTLNIDMAESIGCHLVNLDSYIFQLIDKYISKVKG